MARNIEIMARIESVEALASKAAAITDKGPIEITQDNTFFRCDSGKLKLRAFSRDEGEQITMVMEGVLYFEQGEKVVGVKAGEVIAIPAHAPHAVFTGEAAVKALDAWSPVMAKYMQRKI